MDIDWNVTYIDPENVLNIARGDKDRVFKYLNQFQELIPPRIESLKASLAAEDRKMTRQILHQMSPQLQFFGISDVVIPIGRLEHEYLNMPIDELTLLVNNILVKLDCASKEIEMILKNNF